MKAADGDPNELFIDFIWRWYDERERQQREKNNISQQTLVRYRNYVVAITLELRPLPHYERIADEVRRLCLDEGMKLLAISRKLGCGYNVVWRAFSYWHTSRGLAVPAIPLGGPRKAMSA